MVSWVKEEERDGQIFCFKFKMCKTKIFGGQSATLGSAKPTDREIEVQNYRRKKELVTENIER